MPQINRIRVNNIKYNFGTQFYDDFLMRFSCKNTIYDLANGGGKSVLMLLLLQTIIPNCTLDEKQPVEKLFRTASGSTTIHSLVEWKLDGCDVKDGFRYMTCGFCARKGKDNSDEDGTTGTGIKSESANIDYFNYCIFYREFGDNDIKNLPLVNGSERITYNGLRTYLKDLERRDFGVKVMIFDRKSDYQSFINNYGIYESQWEIIRGINKTEGHVRTYFENSYKTTRKVVEDLLIEEIIEKSYNNRIGNDGDDEQMAKTLLDIKDKLLELAARREDMSGYDRQAELLNMFAGRIESFNTVYAKKEGLKNTLVSYLSKAKAKSEKLALSVKESEEKIAALEEQINREEMLISLADILEEENSLGELSAMAKEREEELKLLAVKRDEYRDAVNNARIAADYLDYLADKSEYDKLFEFMSNRGKDEVGIMVELKELAARKNLYVKDNVGKIDAEIARLDNILKTLADELGRFEDEAKTAENNRAVSEGKTSGLTEELRTLNENVSELMKGTDIFISDNARSKAEELSAELDSVNESIRKLNEETGLSVNKLEVCLKEKASKEAMISVVSDRISDLSKEYEDAKKNYDLLSGVSKVYGESDINRLRDVIRRVVTEMTGENLLRKEKLKHLDMVLAKLREGVFPFALSENPLYVYIEEHYPKAVITGEQFISELAPERRRELVTEYPFLPYALLLLKEYEFILNDNMIRSMEGSGVLPIISVEDINNGNVGLSGISLICKDMSFIYDEAALSAEIKKIAEEKDHLISEAEKHDDRLMVATADLRLVETCITNTRRPSEIEEELEAVRTELSGLEAKIERLSELEMSLKDRSREVAAKIKELGVTKDSLALKLSNALQIAMLNDKINECSKKLRASKNDMEAAAKSAKVAGEIALSKKKVWEDNEKRRAGLLKRKDDILLNWKRDYLKYYDPKTVPSREALSEEEVDVRYAAMVELINDKQGDVADKERLMENYRTSCEKLEKSMELKGVTLKEAASSYEAGNLAVMDHETILRYKNEQDRLESEIENKENELSGISTRLNRIEGSIAHGRRILSEKYGEFDEPMVSDVVSFKREHSAELNNIRELLEENRKSQREYSKAANGYVLMQKDLERIVKNMGIDAESILPFADEDDSEVDVSAYEEAGKDYDKLVREELKKREEFLREKDKLVKSLNFSGAFELANELENSICVPEDAPDAKRLAKGIEETIDCIRLEKDRIGKSIEAMESIKESFVNRCIQICANIKTELERFPKLSKITMDDEVIPMLSLQIPYIKEELYKDRMSVYIDETVSSAENFSTTEEKLKFIKNRLTWKRLFSVIVTDMNSIRLNLYKRERIKDQSRYLKYEEAVGSTGQSQGIYIQFLVAIINYISNINAGHKEASVLGKTIFIDNPFGAAKDVYIWEPIFKLLKTNHVQLIVPARGATPAITGRFDVNYVLGQRLVGDRQQTVVVDYRSQVSDDELEYNRLNFTQESLQLEID